MYIERGINYCPLQYLCSKGDSKEASAHNTYYMSYLGHIQYQRLASHLTQCSDSHTVH